jgi:hypothetical protein
MGEIVGSKRQLLLGSGLVDIYFMFEFGKGRSGAQTVSNYPVGTDTSNVH